MGIDYYYLRASYPWPEQSYDPTYPVKWTSQFYTISDVSQVLYLSNLALCDAIDSKETFYWFFRLCSCLKVSNHFPFLIIWYLLFFHQSWTFVLTARLLSFAISPVQGLVVKFLFFCWSTSKWSRLSKGALKSINLSLILRNLMIFLFLLVSLGPPWSLCALPDAGSQVSQSLSNPTEMAKSSRISKILFKFHTCGFLGC